MMKVYINIKRNSNLRLHQPFNKRIGLMKRERTHRTLHHFSFGERFDETMMNVYHYGYQSIILSTHQFIGFYPPTSLPDKRTEGNATIRRQVGQQAGRMSDRQGKAYHIDDKKRSAYTASTLTGFWKQKSHSSLGHFLYAVQAQLKMPQ